MRCNCRRGQLLYFIEKEGDAMADKGDGECGTIDSILDKYVGCKLHCTYKASLLSIILIRVKTQNESKKKKMYSFPSKH